MSEERELHWLVELVASVAGVIGYAIILGGPAIIFFSLSWPILLLIVIFGGGPWLLEIWQDHRAFKKSNPEWIKEKREAKARIKAERKAATIVVSKEDGS